MDMHFVYASWQPECLNITLHYIIFYFHHSLQNLCTLYLYYINLFRFVVHIATCTVHIIIIILYIKHCKVMKLALAH